MSPLVRHKVKRSNKTINRKTITMALKEHISKILIGYAVLLNIIVCVVLFGGIKSILDGFSLFLLTLLIINLFIAMYDIIFLFRKNNSVKDWRLTLLINSIYCFISSFSIRIFGIVVSNIIGIDLSPYFIKNHLGIGYGFNYGMFAFAMKYYPYDPSQLYGFAI